MIFIYQYSLITILYTLIIIYFINIILLINLKYTSARFEYNIAFLLFIYIPFV